MSGAKRIRLRNPNPNPNPNLNLNENSSSFPESEVSSSSENEDSEDSDEVKKIEVYSSDGLRVRVRYPINMGRFSLGFSVGFRSGI